MNLHEKFEEFDAQQEVRFRKNPERRVKEGTKTVRGNVDSLFGEVHLAVGKQDKIDAAKADRRRGS